MNKETYQTNGKSLTFRQYVQYKKEQEKLRHLQRESGEERTTKPGRCPICDHTKFRLTCGKNALLTRTCQNPTCGDKQYF